MTLLSKEQILGADDLDYSEVEVPEWGGRVRVCVMPGWARDQYDRSLVGMHGKAVDWNNLRAKFLSYCVVDDDNKLMFSQKDIVALGEKSSKALQRVFETAQELNNLGIDNVEEAAKN